jgi:hypothetical protein
MAPGAAGAATDPFLTCLCARCRFRNDPTSWTPIEYVAQPLPERVPNRLKGAYLTPEGDVA